MSREQEQRLSTSAKAYKEVNQARLCSLFACTLLVTLSESGPSCNALRRLINISYATMSNECLSHHR